MINVFMTIHQKQQSLISPEATDTITSICITAIIICIILFISVLFMLYRNKWIFGNALILSRMVFARQLNTLMFQEAEIYTSEELYANNWSYNKMLFSIWVWTPLKMAYNKKMLDYVVMGVLPDIRERIIDVSIEEVWKKNPKPWEALKKRTYGFLCN